MTTKTCAKCHETFDTVEFPKNSGSSDGLSYWCRGCHRSYAKERRKQDLPRQRWLSSTYNQALRELKVVYQDEFDRILQRIRE